MPTTLLIAKLIGPIVALVGAMLVANPRGLDEVGKDVLAHRGTLFIAGSLALLGGLAIVNTHNVWTGGWPVAITVIGWLMVLGGVLRMAFPGLVTSIGEAMLARTALLRGLGAAQLAFGAFLSFKGYA